MKIINNTILVCSLLALPAQAGEMPLKVLKVDEQVGPLQSLHTFVQRDYDLYSCEIAIMYHLAYLKDQKLQTSHLSSALVERDDVQKYINMREALHEQDQLFHSRCKALCQSGGRFADKFANLYRDVWRQRGTFQELEPKAFMYQDPDSVAEALKALVDKVKEHKNLQAYQNFDYGSVCTNCIHDQDIARAIADRVDYYSNAITVMYLTHMENRVLLMQELENTFSYFLQQEQDFEQSGMIKSLQKDQGQVEDEEPLERSWLCNLKVLCGFS
ncbi:MAG: hypothetical protein OXC30_02735 [Alphaproteobacteria bacterium]|nr:hypothetical protein [Alphaproteobacteria bacterium]